MKKILILILSLFMIFSINLLTFASEENLNDYIVYEDNAEYYNIITDANGNKYINSRTSYIPDGSGYFVKKGLDLNWNDSGISNDNFIFFITETSEYLVWEQTLPTDILEYIDFYSNNINHKNVYVLYGCWALSNFISNDNNIFIPDTNIDDDVITEGNLISYNIPDKTCGYFEKSNLVGYLKYNPFYCDSIKKFYKLSDDDYTPYYIPYSEVEHLGSIEDVINMDSVSYINKRFTQSEFKIGYKKVKINVYCDELPAKYGGNISWNPTFYMNFTDPETSREILIDDIVSVKMNYSIGIKIFGFWNYAHETHTINITNSNVINLDTNLKVQFLGSFNSVKSNMLEGTVFDDQLNPDYIDYPIISSGSFIKGKNNTEYKWRLIDKSNTITNPSYKFIDYKNDTIKTSDDEYVSVLEFVYKYGDITYLYNVDEIPDSIITETDTDKNMFDILASYYEELKTYLNTSGKFLKKIFNYLLIGIGCYLVFKIFLSLKPLFKGKKYKR